MLAACGSQSEDATASNNAIETPEEVTSETGQSSNENGQQEASTGAAIEAAVTPPAGFIQCRTCHNVKKDGPSGVGPNLWNVMGKPAAQKAGFAYSPAMKSSGLTWDEATLDTYLKEPLKTVPGTKMAYAGLRNDKQRAEVIAYMAALKD